MPLKSIVSSFRVGNSYFRTELVKQWKLIRCLSVVGKRNFEKYGTFNTKLTRNQDIEFNKRIKRRRKDILIPIHIVFIMLEKIGKICLTIIIKTANGIF